MDSPRRPELPAKLRAFLYSCIDSIEQLEILEVLQGSQAAWSARDVADRVGTSDGRARVCLEALAARGLAYAAVHPDGVSYSFRPSSPTLAEYCEELGRHLDTSRTDVIRFVAALPPPSIRSFANAFKLRDTE